MNRGRMVLMNFQALIQPNTVNNSKLLMRTYCNTPNIAFGSKKDSFESTQSLNVKNELAKMPVKDRKILEKFFRKFVVKKELGYSLLGNKPMSEGDPGCILTIKDGKCYQHQDTFEKELKVWNKYKDKFPMPDFILKGSKDEIWIINKKAFLNTVKQNNDLFKNNLENYTTPENLLKSLENPETSVGEVLGKNDVLYGILFGYGRQNSLLYKRFNELIDKNIIPIVSNGVPVKYTADSNVVQSEGFSSAQKELDYIVKKFGMDKPYFGVKIMTEAEKDQNRTPNLPSFQSITGDPETIQLMKSYEKTQKKLAAECFATPKT